MRFGPAGRRLRERLRCRCASRNCARRWAGRADSSSPGRRDTRSTLVEASSTSTGSKNWLGRRMPPTRRRRRRCYGRRSVSGVDLHSPMSPTRSSRGRPSRVLRSCDWLRSSAGSRLTSNSAATRDLVGELDALVKVHPLRERMRSQHMLALYRSGRQAEALGSFQEARTMLVEELGIEPGPVLRQLELAILRQDSSLDLAGTATPGRAVLVCALAGDELDSLLALAEPLVDKPSRELIVASLLDSESELAVTNNALRTRQEGLVARGIVARTACFTTAGAAADAVRLSTEQDVDLLLLLGTRSPLEDPSICAVLAAAPCDVGVLVERENELGPDPCSCRSAAASTTGRRSSSEPGFRLRSRFRSGLPVRGRQTAIRAACSRAHRLRFSERSG